MQIHKHLECTSDLFYHGIEMFCKALAKFVPHFVVMTLLFHLPSQFRNPCPCSRIWQQPENKENSTRQRQVLTCITQMINFMNITNSQ